MNKVRRSKIAEAIELIEQAKEILESVKDEEQEAFDNMPEGPQCSERGEIMDGYVGTLEEFIDNLDTDELQEIVDG